MAFLYSILLKLLYPTSIALLLLLLSALLRHRANRSHVSGCAPCPSADPSLPSLPSVNPPRSLLPARFTFWSALAILFICGNGWVVKYSTRYLERRYPALAQETTDHGLQTLDQDRTNSDSPLPSLPPVKTSESQVSGLTPLPRRSQTKAGPPSQNHQPPVRHSALGEGGSTLNSQPIADAILVLGGGTRYKTPPRQTVEVSEAGDRVLYAAYLFRNGLAPKVICTSGIATGGIGPHPASNSMSELLQSVGVPEAAIVKESASRNTHEHGSNLYPMLQDLGVKRIFLVTSALHMPRSMAVFKKSCPGIEFIPAPTDYRIDDTALPFYRQLVNLIPTPSAYVQFSETTHEYLGIAYYKLRGWL